MYAHLLISDYIALSAVPWILLVNNYRNKTNHVQTQRTLLQQSFVYLNASLDHLGTYLID